MVILLIRLLWIKGDCFMTSATPLTVSNPHRWKALSILSLAQFLIILDTSIIGVVLLTIQGHFGITRRDLQWIFNAYVIAFGTALLLRDRLSDTLGHMQIFVIGFITLTAASVLAEMARTIDVLIAARIVHGVGGRLDCALLSVDSHETVCRQQAGNEEGNGHLGSSCTGWRDSRCVFWAS